MMISVSFRGGKYMFRKFLALILILALSGCTKTAVNNTQMGIVGENEPITRAEVARMMSLNSYTIEEINKMERKITFEDTDISKWYDKYINAAFSAGLIAGVDEAHFAPEEYLTLRQAQFLLDKMKTDNKVKLQYAQEDKDKPIPYNIWVIAFEKDMNTEKLKTQELKIYADKNQYSKLGDNFFITDIGITYYEGYEQLASDDEITAIVNESTIVALKTIGRASEYTDMEVVDRGDEYVRVKVPGGIRKYSVESNSVNVGDIIKIKIESDGTYTVE